MTPHNCKVCITLYHSEAKVLQLMIASHAHSNSFDSFQDTQKLGPILAPEPGIEPLEEGSQARGL